MYVESLEPKSQRAGAMTTFLLVGKTKTCPGRQAGPGRQEDVCEVSSNKVVEASANEKKVPEEQI